MEEVKKKKWRTLREAWGALMILYGVVMRPLTSKPLLQARQSTPGFHTTKLAIHHKARRAAMCSMGRMRGELHLTEVVGPNVHQLSYIWMMTTSNG